MWRTAYCKTGGSGCEFFLSFAIASATAATISFAVATHSNGLISRPASSRKIGIVSSESHRPWPNILNSAAGGGNGYIVRNTATQLPPRPDQESERLRLQLLESRTESGKLE